MCAYLGTIKGEKLNEPEPKHVSRVECERSDHISFTARASFFFLSFLSRLRSACSIRSAPLAQPKMPFGNLLVPESVEQAKQ